LKSQVFDDDGVWQRALDATRCVMVKAAEADTSVPAAMSTLSMSSTTAIKLAPTTIFAKLYASTSTSHHVSDRRLPT